MGKALVKAPLNIISGFKRIPLKIKFLALGAIVLVVFIFALNFRINAQSTGGMIGENAGTLTGRAVGSLDGLTRGQIEGYEAGKEEGLSAKDTTAELTTKIQEVQRLEVLTATGTYIDVFETKNLTELLGQKYNAVFTVDLGTADIELLEDGLHILLDQPVVEFYQDGEAYKIAEFEAKSKKISEEGNEAAINSLNIISQKAEEELQSNESMMATARNAAENQLKQLVKAVSLSKPEVIVEFRGGTENE